MSCFVSVVNFQTEKRLLWLQTSSGNVSYQHLRSVIKAEESASPQLQSGRFEFWLPMQTFHVQLPLEQEPIALIEITNNLTVFVKLLDNQPPPTTATTNNSGASAASASLSSTTTAGPVTTVGGATVTQAPSQSMVGPSITGPSITGPTITGPTIHINLPQNIQQSAPSTSVMLPRPVQAVLKKVGHGSTMQPAAGKPGAKVPDLFLSTQERAAALRQKLQDLTSDPVKLLETHFNATAPQNDKVSDYLGLFVDCE